MKQGLNLLDVVLLWQSQHLCMWWVLVFVRFFVVFNKKELSF